LRYLPVSTVRYPLALIRVAMVSVSTILYVLLLLVTPVRYEYIPLNRLARAGPHSGVSMVAFMQSIQRLSRFATTDLKS
jgi:hypothetical protein